MRGMLELKEDKHNKKDRKEEIIIYDYRTYIANINDYYSAYIKHSINNKDIIRGYGDSVIKFI